MASSVELAKAVVPGTEEAVTPKALEFVANLSQARSGILAKLLSSRIEYAESIAMGATEVGFYPQTIAMRNENWRIEGIPADLMDRRVEITGPANDPKMVINALNSGANVYMADFEDSMAPTWKNVLMGQLNVRRAVRRKLVYTSPDSKQYSICKKPAVLMVRPRGLHLSERHMTIDGAPLPGCLVDAGLFLHNNAKELLERGSGPYLYIPKLEHYSEALWWEHTLQCAEMLLQLPPNSIKVTVLIETLPAVFQMDEILCCLRNRITGLNCGRWDYLFSFIKTLGMREGILFPDRSELTMDKPFLTAYSRLLIQTCHKRGAYAMGGMAAQIPNKKNPEADAESRRKVHEDKVREVLNGHDGTWVAHPGLSSDTRNVFDEHMKGPNQLERTLDDFKCTAEMLLQIPQGTITEQGVRTNARVSVQYLASWLTGQGCVPINYLMEDAATAEISRTQLWHWTQRKAKCSDGREITSEYVRGIINDETEQLIAKDPSADTSYRTAAELIRFLTLKKVCAPFLTSEAYELLS